MYAEADFDTPPMRACAAMLVGGVLNPRCLREINVFVARLVLIVVGVTTRIFFAAISGEFALACRRRGVGGRRHRNSTARHASHASGLRLHAVRYTCSEQSAASCGLRTIYCRGVVDLAGSLVDLAGSRQLLVDTEQGCP